MNQKIDDKNKLYSLHAPEVECISKGKAHQRYEFGVKASLVTTHRRNFIVSIQALPGNPYDGHTLVKALSHVKKLTRIRPQSAFVDLGYRGHGEARCQVYIARMNLSRITYSLRRDMHRRNAIEPLIGHFKSKGLFSKNYLKTSLGDKINALLCELGHNLRIILRQLRIFCSNFYPIWEVLE